MDNQDWYNTVNSYFPGCAPAAAACLSCAAALLLEDVSVCPALVLVGPPSTAKTTVLDFFRLPELTHVIDSFSAKSMVSHFASKKPDELADSVDLLPRIKHKLVIVADLSPFFSKRMDDLTESIGIMTRVLDGQGYISHSGVHGQRGEHGDFRFGFIAATTPIGGQVWRVMSTLGPRLLMFEMPDTKPTRDEQVAEMQGELTYQDKVAECRAQCSTRLQEVWLSGGARVGGLRWLRAGDDKQILARLVALAELGILLRGIVSKDKQITDSETEYTPAMLEGPARYRQSLYNIARGHALLQGRTQLSFDDLQVPALIVLSTGPVERTRIIRYLARHGSIKSNNEAGSIIGRAWSTSTMVLQHLEQLGLLQHDDVWTLTSPYEWLVEMDV